MKFGVALYNWEPFSYNIKVYEEVAAEAERLGYDSLLITDHFMRPHAEGHLEPRRHTTHEAWSLLAYLAAKTSTIRLGTVVSPIPLRQPQLLAKTVATVDLLSGGRTILGVGPGWDQAEFEGYLGHYPSNRQRVEMTEEGVTLIRKLWREPEVNFEGKYYRAKNAVLEPKPIQRDGPPIWFGAIRDKMLEVTAKLGDGWIPGRAVGATLEHYRQSVPKLREFSAKYNRTKPLTYALMGYFIDPRTTVPLPAIGPIDKAAELIEQYREAGCEYVSAMFFPAERYIEMMRDFAENIVSSFT